MNDVNFMTLAIKEAQKSSEPLKCGVVIAQEGEIVSSSFNSQREDRNATYHAEIKAIGEAGAKLGNKNLNDCVIYCTCEPCVMCLSAIAYAKIKKLVFGLSLEDIRPEASSFVGISLDEFLSKSSRKFEVMRNFLEAECKVLIDKHAR